MSDRSGSIVHRSHQIELPDRRRPLAGGILDRIVDEGLTLATGAEILRIVVTKVTQNAGQLIVDLVVHTVIAVRRGRAQTTFLQAMVIDDLIYRAESNIRHPELRRRAVNALLRQI